MPYKDPQKRLERKRQSRRDRWRTDPAFKQARIAANLRWWEKQPPEYKILLRVRSRAKRYGLKFNLTIMDIVIPKRCPVLGLKLSMNVGGQNAADTSPALDRFDNKQGYVRGNVRVISTRANRIKNDATVGELEKIIAYMRAGA